MREFEYLNYLTQYSISGSMEMAMKRDACFSTIFNDAFKDQTNTYKIILYTSDFELKNRHNNYCPFTKQQVKNHIRQLKDLGDFTFTVDEKEDHMEVTITISKKCNLFHRYVVSWIRYLYEFPYNMLLKDAYKLKQEPRFIFTSISNLMNVCVAAYNWSQRDIHGITETRNMYLPLTKKLLRQRINRKRTLHSIYDNAGRSWCYLNTTSGKDNENFEYWSSPEMYDYRKSIYLQIADKVNL